MSLRHSLLASAATLLLSLSTAAADVTDLTGQEPTSKSLIRALEIENDAPPGTTAAVALMVNFALDSARLTDQARQTLDQLSLALNSLELADQGFLVEGHTDARGATDYNQRLSEERAAAVYAYLVGKGIDPQRLSAAGYGEGNPMPGSDPMDGRNRRVQIVSERVELSATEASEVEVSTPVQVPPLQISLAYEVKLRQPDGSYKTVDPTATVFATGDRIFLEFASSLTGIFDAYNITPAGDVTQLGSWVADGSQGMRLPPAPDAIAFKGDAGSELLILQFYPCETAKTRPLVIQEEILEALPDCSSLTERSFRADRSRDLAVEADADDGIGAFIELPVEEVAAAAEEGFALTVSLKHE
jgi:outer membrane protein OmpA-like peptidoglycan-associated protein